MINRCGRSMWPCRHRYWYREAAEGEKLRGYKQRLVYKQHRALEAAKAEGGKKWDLSPRQKQNRFLMGPRWQHAARLSRISVREKNNKKKQTYGLLILPKQHQFDL